MFAQRILVPTVLDIDKTPVKKINNSMQNEFGLSLLNIIFGYKNLEKKQKNISFRKPKKGKIIKHINIRKLPL